MSEWTRPPDTVDRIRSLDQRLAEDEIGGIVPGSALKVYGSVTLPNLAAGSEGKVEVNTVETDLLKGWNATTKRWTPSRAGYYVLGGFWQSSVILNDGNFVDLGVYKNGAALPHYGSAVNRFEAASSSYGVQGISTFLVYANGTTDYFELYGNCTAASHTGTAVLFGFCPEGVEGPKGERGERGERGEKGETGEGAATAEEEIDKIEAGETALVADWLEGSESIQINATGAHFNATLSLLTASGATLWNLTQTEGPSGVNAITAPPAGQNPILILRNATGAIANPNINFNHETEAGPLENEAKNRIYMQSKAQFVLPTGGVVIVIYDHAAARWIQIPTPILGPESITHAMLKEKIIAAVQLEPGSWKRTTPGEGAAAALNEPAGTVNTAPAKSSWWLMRGSAGLTTSFTIAHNLAKQGPPCALWTTALSGSRYLPKKQVLNLASLLTEVEAINENESKVVFTTGLSATERYIVQFWT